MTEKRITSLEVMEMNNYEFQMFKKCLEYNTWRLFGLNWNKFIYFYREIATGDYVFIYE